MVPCYRTCQHHIYLRNNDVGASMPNWIIAALQQLHASFSAPRPETLSAGASDHQKIGIQRARTVEAPLQLQILTQRTASLIRQPSTWRQRAGQARQRAAARAPPAYFAWDRRYSAPWPEQFGNASLAEARIPGIFMAITHGLCTWLLLVHGGRILLISTALLSVN
jgi:hypothetical protein